jgi:hypothetical protein
MPSPTPIAGENGATLHASRRLDWRFLLPDPSLDVVAYAGPSGNPMVAALRAFSRSLTLLDGVTDPGAYAGRFRVIVLHAPTGDLLARSRPMLAPGGWIYAEFQHRRLAGVGPGAAVRRARAAGYSEISAQWHWPAFESCTRIVSLDDPTAFAFSLARGHRGPVARTKAVAARTLVATGLLARAVSCFSIVARA